MAWEDKRLTYHVWYTMLWRCRQTKGRAFEYYGSRGIKVCDRWKSFDNFLEDMGYKPEKMTLDRIDNDKGYSPENCRWATMKTQSRNTRTNRYITVDDITDTVAGWCDRLPVNKWSVRRWAYFGDDVFREKVKSLK